jgi:hypothetical protein
MVNKAMVKVESACLIDHLSLLSQMFETSEFSSDKTAFVSTIAKISI